MPYIILVGSTISFRISNCTKCIQSFPNYFISRIGSFNAKSANGLDQTAVLLLALTAIKYYLKFTKFMSQAKSQGLCIGFLDGPS